ncbi:helix-turn-helix domain-containing protein [Escherichia coli]
MQQIAYLVGYSSETAFSQSFKKQFEQTPTRYRIACQKSKTPLLD